MIPLLLLAAATGGFQDTAQLDRAVAGFTGHATGEPGGARASVDPRLRLAPCPMVALSWRSDAHDAVVINCPGPDWRLFVQVQRVAPIGASQSVAAPALSMPAGPPVIKRGDPVMVEAGTDGFTITREGTAMADAAAGARFFVKIEEARQPIQAVAIASGQARLPGWSQ